MRRLAVALGLFGILLYASLIPRHIVSELIGGLVDAELGTSVMCHAGDGPANPADGKVQPKCPFCQGYAAFQLTTPDAGVAFVILPPAAAKFLPAQNYAGLWRAAVAPQSRGPPPFPV